MRLGPILRDATWLKLADKHAVLCTECMFQRANERGVVLTLADLQQCGFNVRSPAKGSRGLLGEPVVVRRIPQP